MDSLEDVKNYGNTSEAQAAIYDRNHPRYPYKSHGQWLKAAYGGLACTVLVLFNGINPFFTKPFDTRRFIADYVGVSRDSFALYTAYANIYLDSRVHYTTGWLQNQQAWFPYFRVGARAKQ